MSICWTTSLDAQLLNVELSDSITLDESNGTPIAFSDDGWVAFKKENSVALRNFTNPKISQALEVYSPTAMAFSDNSKWLAIGSADKTLLLYEKTDKGFNQVASIEQKPSLKMIKFWDNLCVTIDEYNQPHIYSIESKKLEKLRFHSLLRNVDIYDIEISNDGRNIFLAAQREVFILERKEGKYKLVDGRLCASSTIKDIAITPDGKRLFVTEGETQSVWTTEGYMRKEKEKLFEGKNNICQLYYLNRPEIGEMLIGIDEQQRLLAWNLDDNNLPLKTTSNLKLSGGRIIYCSEYLLIQMVEDEKLLKYQIKVENVNYFINSEYKKDSDSSNWVASLGFEFSFWIEEKAKSGEKLKAESWKALVFNENKDRNIPTDTLFSEAGVYKMEIKERRDFTLKVEIWNRQTNEFLVRGFFNFRIIEEKTLDVRRDYALLIANQKYKRDSLNRHEKLKDLKQSISDVKKIGNVLAKYYDFKIDTNSMNLGSEEIREKLADYQKTTFNPQDQLLIYVSGHGIIPTGATNAAFTGVNYNYNSSDYITIPELLDIIRGIDCKHVLFIVDACYSSTGYDDFKGESKDTAKVIDRKGKEFGSQAKHDLINELEQESRLSSKRLITTSDEKTAESKTGNANSPFVNQIINILTGVKAGHYIKLKEFEVFLSNSLVDINNRLIAPAYQYNPSYYTFGEKGEGVFYFIKKM